jgi:hypothetical protein
VEKTSENLKEVKAEMLLHYLYPEMDNRWTVEYQGTFYRNYNCDLIAYDTESGLVEVARDSFVKLLPTGMLFPESSLKGRGLREKADRLKERRRLLLDLFQPIDNVAFKRQMSMEREVAALLDSRLHYVLSTYFHYDLKAEQNVYIRQMAGLLPMVRNIRGDYLTIRNLLSVMFGCEVTCTTGRHSDTDHTRCWMIKVTYELLIEGLDAEGYGLLTKDVEELRQFMKEWFVPFDTECFISVKWHKQGRNDTEHWLLDYNTELKT